MTKSWQEKRDELMHKHFMRAFGRPGKWLEHDYSTGFEAGRADTLERMKKVREALEFYAKCDGYCATDECVCNKKIAREALKEFDEDNK